MKTTRLDSNVLRVHSFLRRTIKDQMEGSNFARKMENDGTRGNKFSEKAKLQLKTENTKDREVESLHSQESVKNTEQCQVMKNSNSRLITIAIYSFEIKNEKTKDLLLINYDNCLISIFQVMLHFVIMHRAPAQVL